MIPDKTERIVYKAASAVKEDFVLTYHAENTEVVLRHLESSREQGLSQTQAGERLREYGENRLREKPKKTLLQRFLAQFKDAMILILLAAAAVSFAVACAEGEPGSFWSRR